MKTIALTLIILTSAAAPVFADGTNLLNDETARASYAIGMNLGHAWKQNDVDVDYDLVLRGIKDAESGGASLMTPQEMHDTLVQLQRSVMARREKMQSASAEKNEKEGAEFLAQNKTKPGVVTLPDGLQYKIITDGNGESPAPDDIVTVNYSGTFVDGKEFDSSAKAGHPIQFRVNGVIPGWTEALEKMKVGSKWQLFIPSNLAYGHNGYSSAIPPDATLIFEIELLSVSHPTPAAASRPVPPITSDIIKVPSAAEMKKGAKIETIKASDVQNAEQTATN